jgi:hypothetical protein
MQGRARWSPHSKISCGSQNLKDLERKINHMILLEEKVVKEDVEERISEVGG